jgi:hypothetical protein
MTIVTWMCGCLAGTMPWWVTSHSIRYGSTPTFAREHLLFVTDATVAWAWLRCSIMTRIVLFHSSQMEAPKAPCPLCLTWD